MGMFKIVTPESWGWDREEPIVQHLKIASHGRLKDEDRQSVLKRAGHHFEKIAKDIKFERGEYPAHIIAVGAAEYWGPNRRGDEFRKTACDEQTHTFVSLAKFFRDHEHDHAKDFRYGDIKVAYMNPEMKRVELLVGLYETKEAADRDSSHLGMVADREIDLLSRGMDFPTSMGAAVPFDVCTACGNQAPTPKDYCDEDTCTYGGCKYKLAMAYDDGYIQAVDNPKPYWMDISSVGRGACRICFGSKADYIKTAADLHLPVSSALLAEHLGIKIGKDFIFDSPYSNIKFDSELSKIAAAMSPEHGYSQERTWASLRLPATIHPRNLVLCGLAKEAMVIPPDKFAREVSGVSDIAAQQVKKIAAAEFVLAIQQDRHRELMQKSDTRTIDPRAPRDAMVIKFADDHGNAVGLSRAAIDHRYHVACLRGYKLATIGDEIKSSVVSSEVKSACDEYLGYLFNVLPTLVASHGTETADRVIDYLQSLS